MMSGIEEGSMSSKAMQALRSTTNAAVRKEWTTGRFE
jgi:hypothetical protein